MFCGKCGSQWPEGTKFCKKCGAPMQAPDAGAPAPTPEPAAPAAQVAGGAAPAQAGATAAGAAAKGGFLSTVQGKVIAGVIALAVVVGGGVGIGAALSPGGSDNNAPAVASSSSSSSKSSSSSSSSSKSSSSSSRSSSSSSSGKSIGTATSGSQTVKLKDTSLEIRNLKLTKTYSNSYQADIPHVTGTLYNTSNSTRYNSVTIRIGLYDSSGKELGTQSVIFTGMAPGNSKSFDESAFSANPKTVASATTVKILGYSAK